MTERISHGSDAGVGIAEKLEPVIGLEVHAQLLTRSKMFCACSADYADSPPNTHVCAVCGGMPGALPVVNARAVEFTVRTALALDCRIDERSKFDRKNYPYADLPKGYQISQYDMPIGQDGTLEFRSGDALRRCGIVRVHLEEDTGKTTHTTVEGREVSLVDYNRSGVPLMEIVGRPELHSPEDATGILHGIETAPDVYSRVRRKFTAGQHAGRRQRIGSPTG